MYPDANQNTALCSCRICKEWSANLEHICNSVFFLGYVRKYLKSRSEVSIHMRPQTQCLCLWRCVTKQV